MDTQHTALPDSLSTLSLLARVCCNVVEHPREERYRQVGWRGGRGGVTERRGRGGWMGAEHGLPFLPGGLLPSRHDSCTFPKSLVGSSPIRMPPHSSAPVQHYPEHTSGSTPPLGASLTPWNPAVECLEGRLPPRRHASFLVQPMDPHPHRLTPPPGPGVWCPAHSRTPPLLQ